MKELTDLTWHDVVDSSGDYQPFWGSIDNFFPLVVKLGYKYFNWNGFIYERIGDTYVTTKIRVEDLK